ncbi:MAG: hypothetical protein K6G16_09590 [Lachnospiraceae bacterium]|nr:hypothetical protein [Lachnospiraceae bacterium]
MQEERRIKRSWKEFSERLIARVQDGRHFAEAVYEPDRAAQTERAAAAAQQFAAALPGCIPVCVDLEKAGDFAGLLRIVLDAIFTQIPEKAGGEAGEEIDELAAEFYKEEEGADRSAESEYLKVVFQELLEDILPETGVRVILILAHFEAAADSWDRYDFGFMRANNFIDCPPSLLLYADRALCEVSELPDGSSPFYNIFGDSGSLLMEFAYE